MAFDFKKFDIENVILITPKLYGDNRGFFLETYKYSEFADFGIEEKFVQDNHSRSAKNVLRGLHYQKNPKAQGKLVRCVRGKILDVAVDIRQGSPTYGRWVADKLCEDNKAMLYIPSGFAHGFLTLSEYAEIVYKTTEEYCAELDCGIAWNDKDINIDWGIDRPILSERDKGLPSLQEADNNFVYGG